MRKNIKNDLRTVRKPDWCERRGVFLFVVIAAIVLDFSRTYTMGDFMYRTTSDEQVRLYAIGTALGLDALALFADRFIHIKRKTAERLAAFMIITAMLFFFVGFIMQNVYAKDLYFATETSKYADQGTSYVPSGGAAKAAADSVFSEALKTISQVINGATVVATSVLVYAVTTARNMYVKLVKLEQDKDELAQIECEYNAFENAVQNMRNEELVNEKLAEARHKLGLEWKLMMELVEREMFAIAENHEAEEVVTEICQEQIALGYGNVIHAASYSGEPAEKTADGEPAAKTYDGAAAQADGTHYDSYKTAAVVSTEDASEIPFDSLFEDDKYSFGAVVSPERDTKIKLNK